MNGCISVSNLLHVPFDSSVKACQLAPLSGQRGSKRKTESRRHAHMGMDRKGCGGRGAADQSKCPAN
eukprot:scaffold49250_cov18-Tisochrysis_lutea.AAC.1